jgi:1,4-dihydroxy-2-naphthoyl-CoA hydrolase
MSTLRPEFTIARLQEWQRGTLPDLLGVRIVALAQGTLTGELTSNPARQKITARA